MCSVSLLRRKGSVDQSQCVNLDQMQYLRTEMLEVCEKYAMLPSRIIKPSRPKTITTKEPPFVDEAHRHELPLAQGRIRAAA